MGKGLQTAVIAREPSRISEAVTPLPLSMEAGEKGNREDRTGGAKVADDAEAGEKAETKEASWLIPPTKEVCDCDLPSS